VGNNNDPEWGIIVTLRWGIIMALIQFKWGMDVAPDKMFQKATFSCYLP
jgi:hypothetical protein